MDSQNLIDKINPSMWASIYNWPFISCCFCMAILILTFKRALSQFYPDFYAKRSVHGFFTLLYLVIGFLAAIPKSYLVGKGYFDRAIVGIISSGVSLGLYHAIIKRLSNAIGVKEEDFDPDEVTKTEVSVTATATETKTLLSKEPLKLESTKNE
jgi:hypothetical protein